jgi:hypothetical protein
MSDFGITLGYEQDKCSICKNIKEIRIIYSRKQKKIAKVCDVCVDEHKEKTAQQIIDGFGKKTTQKHIEILSKEQLEKSGFELDGIKKKD